MNKQSKKVSIIPPNPKYDRKIRAESKVLKVAAYCRVSTTLEQQETSYESQKSYYTNKIASNPNWKFAGLFADDGKSATSTKSRCDFTAMIGRCMAGKIDMIITKSVSRFARNTVDCLQTIRKLKDRNIGILFEKENIYTLESTGELLITILSSQAQEESRNLSENIRWGLTRQYEKGIVNVNYKKFMGYTKGPDRELTIVPEEAEVVRNIFRWYLEGKSFDSIAKTLQKEGVRTVTGNKNWCPSVISKMVSNEKYCGDALLQKTYTIDFLTRKRVINRGYVPKYYIEKNHEPIITKDTFLQAQAERKRRSAISKLDLNIKGKYSSKYVLSNIMFCEECGLPYRRVTWSKGNRKKIVWRCANRLKHGNRICKQSPSLAEEELQSVIIRCLRNVIESSDSSVLPDDSNTVYKAYLEKCKALLCLNIYDDTLVHNLIERISVKAGAALVIQFKTGVVMVFNLY